MRFFSIAIFKFQLDLIADWDHQSNLSEIVPSGSCSVKINIKKFHFAGKAKQFKLFLKLNIKYFLYFLFFKLLISLSKEKLQHDYNLTLTFDNLWFMEFNSIPISQLSLFNVKYNKEILRVVCEKDNNAQKLLEKCLSKIIKQDFSMAKDQNVQNSYCIKIKDSFQAKDFSFGVIINEIRLNQLEFKLKIKQSLYEECLDFHKDLKNYLKREVLDIIFCDLLI